ncbi:hypothetical protein ACN08P_11140 [Photobacterium leiognathi subsp. mandapamensis]|uniref:hypothetical protein n=1 Tax=Photobacterium leiognathi TaxID=553611 RepID=UPI003AF36BD5
MSINSKFTCRVYLGAKNTKVESHRIMFNENTPGRATLTVEGNPDPNTMVAVDLGWGDNISRVFLGYIEKVQPADNGWSSIFCRELSAILFKPLNVTLRHPTLMQVLEEVTNQTGLQFVVPDKAYSKTAIPCFYSDGNGYRVLDELAQAFSIDDLFWQQQGNGQVFVGEWQDSYWASRPITIPQEMMTKHTASRSAKVPAIPRLKPGVVANGLRLSAVEFEGTEVKMTWKMQ